MWITKITNITKHVTLSAPRCACLRHGMRDDESKVKREDRIVVLIVVLFILAAAAMAILLLFSTSFSRS